MGTSPGRRTEPRVEYREAVRLKPDGHPHPIEGRAVNVSATGILVDTPAPCPVGTRIVCDIALPDGPVQARGRVIRVQVMAASSTALAIRFDDISDKARDQLRGLIRRANDRIQPVSVQFDRFPRPVRGRAVLGPDGLRLMLPFRFLRPSSEVDVAFATDDQLLARGVIKGVDLISEEDLTPQIVLNVELIGAAPLPGPEAAGDKALPARRATNGEISPRPQEVERTEIVRVPVDSRPAFDAHVAAAKRRIWPIAVVIAFIAVAAGGAALVRARGAHGHAASPAPAQTAAPALRPPGPFVEPVAPVQRAAEPGAATAQGAAAEAPGLAATGASVEPAPGATAAGAEPAANAEGPGSEAAPVAAEEPSPADDKPLSPKELSIVVEDGTATLVVPLRGSPAGSRSYELAGSPGGVSINLPRAHSTLARGLHRLNRDGFRSVLIKRARGATLLRVMFTSAESRRAKVKIDAHAARIAVPTGS